MSTLKTNNIQHVDRSDPSIIINTDGSVNIAGTMTYEDVTNVDAVGIITGRNNIDAQKQVLVGTGVSVKAGGLNVTAGITTVQALQATTGNFSSNVDVAGELTVAETIAHTGDTNNKISFPAADTIALTTAGTERFKVDSSGNIYVGGVGGSATAGSLFFNDTSANASKIAQVNGSSALTFHTGSSQPERLRITSGGDMGLGTNSPASAHDRVFTIAGTNSAELKLTGSNYGVTNTDGADVLFSYGGLYLVNNETSGHIHFLTGTGTDTERMRITNTGSVGIGTNNPTVGNTAYPVVQVHGTSTNAYFKLTNSTTGVGSADGVELSLSGSDAFLTNRESADIRFRTGGSNERMRINGTGNVSIGGLDPVPTASYYNTASLHIHQTTNSANAGAQVHLTTANKGSAAGDGSQLSQYNGSLYINNQDDGSTYFYNNGSATATITAAGNFGVNTQSPTDKLHVNGTALISSNLYCNNNVYLAANKGIYFDGGTNAVNHLDDYETGTFTCTVYYATGNTTGSHTNTTNINGYYEKVGNLIFVSINLYPTNYNSGNQCIITKFSIPFTPVMRTAASFYRYSGAGNYGGMLAQSTQDDAGAYFNTDGFGYVIVGGTNQGSGYWGHHTGQVNAHGHVSGCYRIA